MRMRLRLRLILLVLAIALMFLLTSCTITWNFTMPLPTTPVESSLVVTSGAYSVRGYIYVNGKYTGKFLESFQSETIYNVSCYQNVSVYIVNTSGYQSHTEYVYTKPGVNYVYFNDWW